MRRFPSLNEIWNLITAGGILIAVGTLSLSAAGFFDKDNGIQTIDGSIKLLVGTFSGVLLTTSVWANFNHNRFEAIFDKISSKIDTISFLMQKSQGRLIVSRDEMEPWALALNGRKSLIMSGMSLRSFVRDQSPAIRRLLSNGGRAEFILLDPEAPAALQAAATYSPQTKPSDYISEVKGSANRIIALKKAFPRQVYLRYLPHIPIASITLLEGGDVPAKIIAELYTLDESSQTRPHLIVDQIENADWFNYFEQELNKIRELSRISS